MSVQAIGKLESSHDYGRYTNLTASALIETGQGTLQGIIINSHTNGTIAFKDALTNTTPVIINTITLGATERWIPFFGAKFTTGLYLVLGGTIDCTVIWN
jgi:hypothetical protein